MSKMKYVQWSGFGTVLLVALAISWYSMMTMATDFFGLPMWLAAAVSVAFDGAAVYVAVLSSEYAKSEDSGLMARLATMAFVGISAWLNWNHAEMLNLGVAGAVFFAAPPVIAGGLFELFLKFENRKELRKRGKVAKALPVFGKTAWLRYPRKTFKVASRIVLHRLTETAKTETGTVLKEDKTPKTDKIEDKMLIVPAKKTVRTKTAKELSSEYPDIDALDADLSINQIVLTLWGGGMKDRDSLVATVSKVKGTEVTKNTVNRCLSRAGLVTTK